MINRIVDEDIYLALRTFVDGEEEPSNEDIAAFLLKQNNRNLALVSIGQYLAKGVFAGDVSQVFRWAHVFTAYEAGGIAGTVPFGKASNKNGLN